MNIVQVPRRFVKDHWGGTETVILETSKWLRAMGHHSEILCPNALARSAHEEIDGISVKRVSYFYPYLGLGSGARVLLDKKGGNLFSFALLGALKKYPKLDLIHLHTGKRVGGIVRHVALKRKIPYIVSLHGGFYDVPEKESATWTAPTQGALEWGRVLGWWVGSRRVLADAAAIVCLGQKEEEELKIRLPEKKTVLLPNGVDYERFANGDGASFRQKYGLAPDRQIILTVSRIDPQKNQLFSVRMLPKLLATHPSAHLVMIGCVTNDPYFKQLEDTVKREKLEKHVTVIRGLPADSRDLVDAYHASHVFILPSIHEPFGIVILEAWAARRAVIAARVGGIPSFVEDQKDGLLFESGDENGFLAKLRAVLDHPAEARGLGESGQAKVRAQYGWDRVTERLSQLYEEVIRENPLR